jgi:hypothetical protein
MKSYLVIFKQHTCRACRVFISTQRCQEHEKVEHPPTLSCSKEFFSTALAHLETHLPLVCFHSKCGALINNIYMTSLRTELLSDFNLHPRRVKSYIYSKIWNAFLTPKRKFFASGNPNLNRLNLN